MSTSDVWIYKKFPRKVKYHHQRWWHEVMHLEGAILLS